MRRLRAELAVLAAPADFRRHDGAEPHLRPDESDADLVGPVKQVIDVVAVNSGEKGRLVPVQQAAGENFVGQPGDGGVHVRTGVQNGLRGEG